MGRLPSQRLEAFQRLRGEGGHRLYSTVNLDWLVRKLGALENYRYPGDLFPSSRFRIGYDQLKGRHTPPSAGKQHLLILQLAAKVAESAVDQALGRLLESGIAISADELRARLLLSRGAAPPAMINVAPTQLSEYHALLDREPIFDGSGIHLKSPPAEVAGGA